MSACLVGSEKCIRDRKKTRGKMERKKQEKNENGPDVPQVKDEQQGYRTQEIMDHGRDNKERQKREQKWICLLSTSDAADETHCADLGGSRTISQITRMLLLYNYHALYDAHII